MMYRVLDIDRQPELVQRFLALPQAVYRQDPNWIAPFTEQVASRLGAGHPFRDFLEQRHFLVFKGDQAIARASVYINRRVTQDGRPIGMFGQFESLNDPEAAKALIERALEWLADKGVQTVWGPMDGSLWLSYRLMTAGFEDAPFYGEPYNPPYYPDLFAAMGFQPIKRWTSTIDGPAGVRHMFEKTQPRYERAVQEGYRFRTLDSKRFDDELRLLYKLISQSFSGFTGFHPIDESHFLALYSGLKTIADPKLVHFALDKAGEVVGYNCVLPDIGDAIRQMKGNSHWLAKLRFLLAKRSRGLIVLYLGITPQEQTKRSGVGGALGHLSARQGMQDQVPIISALMAEGSFANAYSQDPSHRVHTYALYERRL